MTAPISDEFELAEEPINNDPMGQPSPPLPTENTKIVYIGLEIPDLACESIMSTAIEGGIGYWSVARNIKYATPDLEPTASGRQHVDSIHYWSYELADKQEDQDWEDGEGTEPDWHLVDYSVIRLGIKRLFDNASNGLTLTRQYFLIDHGEWMQGYLGHTAPVSSQIWGGQTDADACDTIVQLGLFGSVVYG